MSFDRGSLGKVPTNSASPITVPDPFRISAIRPLTRVSRERNSQVFFLERIKLIQGSFMIKPFISTHRATFPLLIVYLPDFNNEGGHRLAKRSESSPGISRSKISATAL
jgi:hypothetical protein